MSDRVLVAPPGLTRPDLFAERNIEKYVPPPIGPQSSSTYSPNLVVGGPAYFTPEGYQAPPQPQEAFMPTRTGYDPIRDQFNRPPAPMPMPAPAPAPTPAPPPTGGVGDPAPYVPAPAPAPAPQDDDPLLPPGYSYTPPTDRAYTAVMPFRPGARYAYGPDGDRIEVGGDPDYEPRSFPMGPEDSNTSAPAPEPEFVPPPTMPEPNGFFPNMNFEDLDLSGLPDLSKVPGLEDLDFSGLPNYQMPDPAPAPIDLQAMLEDSAGRGRFYGDPMEPMMSPRYQIGAPMFNQSALDRLVAETEALNPGLKLGNPTPDPAPIYTPPPKMEKMFEDYDYGNPNLRDRGMFGPRR